MSFCCLCCSTLASNSSLLNGIFSFRWSLSCFCLRYSTTSEEPPLLFFLRGLQRFHLPRFFSWSDSSIPWQLSCAPLLRLFPPFLCSLRRSIFHRLTSPCQLFLQELGLVLTPSTKCQRHFPLAYFCFILSDKQSQPVSYWSFANYVSWMIKAVEVNGNVVANIPSLFAPVWVLIGFHHQDFSA